MLTPPKDGSMFLGNFGQGFRACLWSNVSSEWTVSEPQLVGNKKIFDAYFDIEWRKENELKSWIRVGEPT